MADYIVARIKGTIALTGGRVFLCLLASFKSEEKS